MGERFKTAARLALAGISASAGCLAMTLHVQHLEAADALQEKVTATKLDRDWGPEQVAGPPNTAQAGDIRTAWASATQDAQKEWLLVHYAVPIAPRSILVYETYNPGALVRITVFEADGTETEVWAGKDPTSPEKKKGISAISLRLPYKILRVKLYLDSPAVPGWNEIDAVGLRDETGKLHWATSVEASTTYAARQPTPAPVRPVQPQVKKQPPAGPPKVADRGKP